MKENSSLEKNGLIVLILTTLSSAINYLSQILMGRFLDISSYGIINSVFSIMLITGVIGTTLSMISSKVVAENLALGRAKKNEMYINALAGWLALGCLLVLFISLIVFFVLNRFFLEQNMTVAIFTVLVVVTSLIPPFFQGTLGGLQEFVILGLYTLVIPIIKMLGVIGLKVLEYVGNKGVCVVFASIILGNVLATILGIILLYNKKIEFHISEMARQVRKNKIEKYYLDSFVVNIFMMILMNVDVLYLKLVVGSDEAGLYSSGLMFGRVIYYCVTALVSVLLPMVAFNSSENGKNSLAMLNKTLGFTLGLTIIFLIPVNIFAESLLGLIFGNKYSLAVPYIKYASFISVSTSLNMILMNYMLGIEKVSFFKKTLVGGFIVFLLMLLITSNRQYVTLFLLGGIGFLIFMINYVYCMKSENKGGTKDEV